MATEAKGLGERIRGEEGGEEEARASGEDQEGWAGRPPDCALLLPLGVICGFFVFCVLFLFSAWFFNREKGKGGSTLRNLMQRDKYI